MENISQQQQQKQKVHSFVPPRAGENLPVATSSAEYKSEVNEALRQKSGSCCEIDCCCCKICI